MTSIHSLPRIRDSRQMLLCLHCSGGSGRQWRALTQSLEPHFDVRTPDLLGYGAPDTWAMGTRVSLDDEAEHLGAFLDHAQGPVHLLGHSYGAAVALQLALRRPGRIASLTLYEPVRFALLFSAVAARSGEAAAIVDARNQTFAIADRFTLAVMAGRVEQAAAMFSDYWGGKGTWAGMEPRRQRAQAELMPKVLAEFQALLSDDLRPSAYDALAMPIRLLGGTGSPLAARLIMRLLADRLPQASSVTIVGLDHLAPIKAPEQVRRHLPAWLRPAQAVPGNRRAELQAA